MFRSKYARNNLDLKAHNSYIPYVGFMPIFSPPQPFSLKKTPAETLNSYDFFSNWFREKLTSDY